LGHWVSLFYTLVYCLGSR